MTQWVLPVDAVTTRAEVASRYGGSTQGGIQPSAKTPNVMIYSDPAKGHQHGYVFDGWDPSGQVYLYTGDGRYGDQAWSTGNRAIRDHRESGRGLRLFVAEGNVPGTGTKRQRYVGEFAIARDVPYLREEAPDDDGMLRSVIVFRLVPVVAAAPREGDLSKTGDRHDEADVVITDIEGITTSAFTVRGTEATIAQRREAELVQRYRASLGEAGKKLRRQRIRPPGVLTYLVTDLYDPDANELFEAKATSNRNDVRLGIGQLLDYARWVNPRPVRRTLLLPARPADDLLQLVHELSIGIVYEIVLGRFAREDPPGSR